MSGIPQIQYPDIVGGSMNAFAAGRQLRDEDDTRNAFRESGGQLAQGNIKGARDTFYRAGKVDEGLKMQARIDAMSEKQREATKRLTAVIGEAALLADTPEKWATIVQGLKTRGIPGVEKYADFSMRDIAIAENGKTAAYLERLDAQTKQRLEQDKYETERGDKLTQQDAEHTLNQDKFGLDQRKFDADQAKPDLKEVKGRLYDAKTQRWIEQPADALDPDGDLPEEVRKALATKDAATLTGYAEASDKAGEAKASLEQIKGQRERTNWEGPTTFGLRRGAGKIIGGDGYFLPDAQDRAAMDTMDAEGAKLTQANASALKGTTSDADLKLLSAPVPDSTMTDDAAEPIIKGHEAAIARTQAKAEMSDQYIRTHGTLRGFNEAWNRFVNEKNLLTQDPTTGKLTFNEKNVLAWRGYVGTPRGRAPAGQTPQAGKTYQPLPEGGFAATKRPAPGAPQAQPQQRQPAVTATKPLKNMADDELMELGKQLGLTER